MWKPLVAQVCKPLVQPALVGLEQRCGASGHGDRVPVGLERAGAPRSDEEALREQLSPNGSSKAGFWHPAFPGVTVGLFSLEIPPSHTHHHPAPSLTPSEPLSSSPSLPPCLSFPCMRAEMEPSCCDPHARAGLTHLAHLHRGRTRPAEPLDAPGSALPSAPGGIHRGLGGSRAGTGQDRDTRATPEPAAPIPVRPAPRDKGITPPSPAGPTPALPLLPSQSRAVTRCAVLCHAQTPFHASSSPSPSIPTSPKPRQQAGIQPGRSQGTDEGLGRGSPWGWDTAGPQGTEQHCQVPETVLQGDGKAEGSEQVVTWQKGDSEELVWWPRPSGSFQGSSRHWDGDRGFAGVAQGSNSLITGTTLVPGTALGERLCPQRPT